MSMMTRLLFVLLVGACCIHTIAGAAFFAELETEKFEYGVNKFCTYDGKRYGVGSKIKDMDACMYCKCGRHGLECYSQVPFYDMEENDKCMVVMVNCKSKWIRKDNPKRRCPKKWIPENMSMVGK